MTAILLAGCYAARSKTDGDIDGGPDGVVDAGASCEDQPDGAECRDGLCHGGECDGDGCFVDGRWYADGAPNPENECEVCAAVSTLVSWSSADLGSCLDGEGTCHGGECCTGCWGGESCHAGTARLACGSGGGPCISCRGRCVTDFGELCTSYDIAAYYRGNCSAGRCDVSDTLSECCDYTMGYGFCDALEGCGMGCDQ